MPLPTNFATGRVTGQFLAGVVDGADADQNAGAVPASGFVTFTASVSYLPNPTASPNPATIFPTPIVAALDIEGYLCTPAPGTLEPSYRGVRLIATDDPDLSVTGWTWNATYSFNTVAGQTLAIPTHSFAVPSDGIVDLTTVVKIPSCCGIGTAQAEALAASAQAAAISAASDAAAAAQAASDAASASAVTDANNSALVRNPDSDTADAVTALVNTAAADKLDVDEAINAYQSQAPLAAAAAKFSTDATTTKTAAKSVADTSAAVAAAPKLDTVTTASTYAVKPDGGGTPIGKDEIFINVADYLAVGDAVTDDTTAIQAALTAAGASLSTKRVIGTGRLYVVRSVSVPDGVTLANIRLKHKSGSTAAAVILSGLGSRADSVEVDGNAAGQTGSVNGIEVSGERTSVSNCYVHHVKWDGIIFTSDVKYGNATNNRVLTTGRYGITLTGSDVTPVQSVVIHGNHVESTVAAGLGIIGVANEVTFSSNTTRNTGGDGIAAYNGNNRRIVCIGNTFYAPANNGIHIAGTALIISNNAAYNVGQTAWFVASDTVPVLTPPSSSVIISNNVVETVHKLGIWIQEVTQATVTGNVINNVTEEHGINVTDCASIVINANEIGNIPAGRGIFLVRAYRVIITNNRIHDCGLHGVYGRDYATGTPGCTSVIATGNSINNTVGGIISSESSNNWIVSNNILASVGAQAVITAGATNQVGTNMVI